jgi:hypothetical protein
VDVPGTRAVAISRAVRCTVNGDGVDKDVVRRILTAHYRPESDSAGLSWPLSSVTPRTVYGVATCSDANRQC